MKEFIRLPERLYQGCPYYVPDMETEIEATFDPKKNPGLDFSDIQPFIAIDEKGSTVGRIAGIINHHANEEWKVKTVRFSMIEFIDDIRVSKALLDAVIQWGVMATLSPRPTQKDRHTPHGTLPAMGQIQLQQIGYVNTHATSTKAGDDREALAISRIFGDDRVHGSSLQVDAAPTREDVQGTHVNCIKIK